MLEYDRLDYEVAEDDYISVLKNLKRRLNYSVENGLIKEEKKTARDSELAKLFAYHKTARSIITALEAEVQDAYKRGLARGKEQMSDKTDHSPVAWRSILSLMGREPFLLMMKENMQLSLLNPTTNNKERKRQASILRAKTLHSELY